MIINCQHTCKHNNICRCEAGHPVGHHVFDECACVEATLNRPDWDHFFMAHARLASLRGSCDRKQVGAVIVCCKRVIAGGYNGAPSGVESCIDAGHQLVTFVDGSVSCVRTIHAERNAIIQCAIVGVSTSGTTLYCTAEPCFACLNDIIQAGILQVVYSQRADAHWTKGVDLAAMANKHGIAWRQLDG